MNENNPMEKDELTEETSASESSLVSNEDKKDDMPVEDTDIPPQAIKESVTPEIKPVYRWEYDQQCIHDAKESKQKRHNGLRNYAIVMSVAFVAAIALLVGVFFIEPPKNTTDPSTPVASLDDLYKVCYPSYVAISIVSEYGTSGAGSGIVMTADGYIATNYHVVEDAKAISVILYDGTTVDADYVDGDEINDIAIIKVAKQDLTPAKIGSSDNTRVGEQVMAIGTPHSINYRGTMTSGYISATNRRYAAQNENGTIQKVVALLQTDTSVNPGNSGGPLFNMKGEVIGIVSMKIAGSQYEGLGFAIPIDGVIDMLNDIIENGELTIPNGGSAYEGAALGITGMSTIKDTTYLLAGDKIYITHLNEKGEICVTDIFENSIPVTDEDALAAMDITDYELYTAPATGVTVTNTNPAFDSSKKLKPFDVIITANGISCNFIETLQEVISTCRVGDKLNLEVWRDGEIISVSVELGRSATME